jgi:hypothetical protein
MWVPVHTDATRRLILASRCTWAMMSGLAAAPAWPNPPEMINVSSGPVSRSSACVLCSTIPGRQEIACCPGLTTMTRYGVRSSPSPFAMSRLVVTHAMSSNSAFS